MDNGWVLVAIFFGGSWILSRIKAVFSWRTSLKDQRRMDSVNSLHYYHEVFQSRFKKLDEKYTQVMADVKNGGNSPRELPDVMISLLWLHEEFTELGEELIIQIAFSRKNWLLNDGYAKSAANYYRVKWQCVCGAVTNKVLAIGECLQELGYIEPDRQVSLKH